MLKDVTKAVKGNKTVMLVIGIIVIVVIIAVVWKIYKGFKTGSNAIGESLGDATIAAQTGINLNRVTFIRGTAAHLWDKGVTNYWVVTNYDEQLFIDNINKMATVKEVYLLDQFFKNKAGYGLGYVIAKSFSDSEKAKLKTEYRGALQQ
jgi:hypothetical protein